MGKRIANSIAPTPLAVTRRGGRAVAFSPLIRIALRGHQILLVLEGRCRDDEVVVQPCAGRTFGIGVMYGRMRSVMTCQR